MGSITVRGYRSTDEPGLLDLWRAALPFDAIDRPTFHRKVLLDPNFDPDWLLVAQDEGSLAGLCLCLARRVPFEKTGMQPEAAWITAFGVAPDRRRRGAGSALLQAALELFGNAGRKTVSLAPYTPNYFVPGVDVERYADGLRFLTRRGFEELDRPMAMDTQLTARDLSEFTARAGRLRAEKGVEVRSMQPHEIPDLMRLLRAHMPDDWVRHAREVLLDVARGIGSYDQFTVAVAGDEVVGYCQFEGEHFGPFGVREGMQGKGIGTVLLATSLQTMQRRGLHNAFVLWTSDTNAGKVYSRFGFRETRRFAVLRRTL